MSGQPGGGNICPECGTQVSGQQGYCGECGADLGPLVEGNQASQAGDQSRGQQQQPPPRQQQPRGQQQPPRQQPQQQDDDGWSTLVIVLVLCGGGLCLIPVLFVVLSAVLGAFVLGLGDTNEVAPNTSFAYDYNEATGEVEIMMRSGDTFRADQVTLEGDGFAEQGAEWHEKDPAIGPNEDVSAGDSIVIEGAGNDFLIEVTWTSESGDTSSVISTKTGPDRAGP